MIVNLEKIAITRSRTGLPLLGVGGGAFTSTFQCRYVLRDEQLASACYVHGKGDLCCSMDQALVPIKIGDIIVEISGTRPLQDGNNDRETTNRKIVDVLRDYILCEPVEGDSSLPESVTIGANLYHNRYGKYFVAPDPQWGTAANMPEGDLVK